MIERIAIATAAALFAAGVYGCGETPDVTLHKQGSYQGKPDNAPWQSAPFNDNKREWEKAIAARNESQNEYARTGGARGELK